MNMKKFQEGVFTWVMQCFGRDIAFDTTERNHRFLEEALELVQAKGCTAADAHALVDYVYGRPVGEPMQEVGGVMVTLAALCNAGCLDLDLCASTELARITSPETMARIREKQKAKPAIGPLPGCYPERQKTEQKPRRVVILTGSSSCRKTAILMEALQQLVDGASKVLVDDIYPIHAPEPGICINDCIVPAQVQHGPVRKRGKGKARRQGW